MLLLFYVFVKLQIQEMLERLYYAILKSARNLLGFTAIRIYDRKYSKSVLKARIRREEEKSFRNHLTNKRFSLRYQIQTP